MLEALRAVQGILQAVQLPEGEGDILLAVEADAEKKSLQGLGRVINAGVRSVLACETVYVALTSPQFEWGCQAALILKKGEELVGEEVREEAALRELAGRPEVWFLHQNFVVYKDRVSFPRDLIDRTCHFEIPGLPADWLVLPESERGGSEALWAMPSVPADAYLKRAHFGGAEQEGVGTLLVGVRRRPSTRLNGG
ncbi:MAG: hypothetical protein HY900_30055 [Deltaproteobacteria bacterium]|nr:hypothetical protein [Deltaproteobacteria bacterium]